MLLSLSLSETDATISYIYVHISPKFANFWLYFNIKFLKKIVSQILGWVLFGIGVCWMRRLFESRGFRKLSNGRFEILRVTGHHLITHLRPNSSNNDGILT